MGNIEQNEPVIRLQYDHRNGGIIINLKNPGKSTLHLEVISNAYDYKKRKQVSISPGKSIRKTWKLAESGNWYDFSVESGDGFLSRFAGRVETGKHGISDPAMATEI
jgi:phospholipase C